VVKGKMTRGALPFGKKPGELRLKMAARCTETRKNAHELQKLLFLKPLIYKAFRTSLKKVSNKVKKGVDIPLKGWYYNQARSRAPNLENDTE
jgi:hypothetical protein